MAQISSVPSLARAGAPVEAPRSEATPPPALVDAMMAHLRAVRPTTGNEALKLLRAAFPYAPLADRVRAADQARRS